MAQHNVTLIPGDGIGPEITSCMQEVVAAAGVDINWTVAHAGAECMERYGSPLPQETLNAIAENGVAIKGPTATPVGAGFRSINVAMRKHFDLFTNLRPVWSIKGAGARYSDVDIVIFRENTEDLYAGIEADVDSPEAAGIIDGLVMPAWATSNPIAPSASSPSAARARAALLRPRSTTRSPTTARKSRLCTKLTS